MKNILLTIDYELFGDGSGDVFKHMVEPTESILNICDKYNIKITIFFEVIEYLRLKQEWERNNNMGYKNNPIEAIESQLQKAAVNGHDIQLHVHPQWVGAQYVNNNWEVDNSNWRLSIFQEKKGYTIENLLQEGKTVIENLICQVVPNYKCTALRVGYYNIMPSTTVYAAMKKIGLRIDSSVYPGGFETSNIANYDYRNISNGLDFWWACPEDITLKSTLHREVLEIPIFSLIQPRWRKILNFHRIKSILFFTKQSTNSLVKSKISKMSFFDKIRFLIESESFTWDFCTFNSSLNNVFIRYIEKKLFKDRNTFVLIGHPKNFVNKIALISLVESFKKRKWNSKTVSQLFDEVNY